MNRCDKQIVKWIAEQEDLWTEFRVMGEEIREFYLKPEEGRYFLTCNGEKYIELKAADLEDYARDYSGYTQDFLGLVDFHSIIVFISELDLNRHEFEKILNSTDLIETVGDKQIIFCKSRMNGKEKIQMIGQVLPEPQGDEPDLELNAIHNEMIAERVETALKSANLLSKLIDVRDRLAFGERKCR